jgi:hypothetical protein
LTTPADGAFWNGTANQERCMARILCCRWCRIEYERIALADGRAAVICVACDLVGVAHEVEHGAQPAAGEPAPRRRRARR